MLDYNCRGTKLTTFLQLKEMVSKVHITQNAKVLYQFGSNVFVFCSLIMIHT